VLKKAVCILSGGMDSTLCAYLAQKDEYELITLHFNYNQRTAQRELKAFRDVSRELGVSKKYEIDIDFFKTIGTSALVDTNIDVPIDGIKEGVPSTYVPFRNGIFISIAAAIAEKEDAQAIFIGVVQEDSSGYPDCKEQFINSMQNSINNGTKDSTNIKLITPLINLSKANIVKNSIEHGVRLDLTWSCYQNGELDGLTQGACGICDSCRLRLNGFKVAKIKDPIHYV